MQCNHNCSQKTQTRCYDTIMGDFFTKNLWEEEPDFAQDNYNDNGESGNDEDDYENYLGAQYVIALIDCHPDMFKSPNPFDWSLKIVLELLQQTIEQTVVRKTGKRNRVGLLLYNTKSGRDDNDQKGNNETGNNNNGEDEDDDDDDDDDDKMDDEEEDEIDDHTTQEQTPVSEKTVHRLLDLELPGIKQVLNLRKMLDKKNRDLQKEFCPTVEEEDHVDLDCAAPLQTALEEATKMFNDIKPKSTSKNNESDNRTIWIFTNQEDPYSEEKAGAVENIAIDAKEERISIVVWPLVSTTQSTAIKNQPSNDEKFLSPFFESIRSKPKPNDLKPNFDRRLQTYKEMDDTRDDMTNEMMKNRRSKYGPLHILRPGIVRSEEPAIMIDWYSVVQLSKRPGKVQIDSHSNMETAKCRITMEKDSGNEVARFWTKPDAEQREIQNNQLALKRFRQFFNFAGELVPITKDDTQTMLKNSNGGFDPGLTILGFKPRDAIPYYHCVSTTYLIFPNDSEIKGSRKGFLSLYRAMVRKNVLAVGEVLHRETLQSRLVAIYPLDEDDDNSPGMYVMQLPFEDDIRAVAPDEASMEFDRLAGKSGIKNEDEPEIATSSTEVEILDPDNKDEILTGNIASEELVDAAIKLMRKQNLNERELGVDYENAALSEFYSYLKSVAFDAPKETNNYDTIISAEGILKIAKAEIDAFNASLPIDIEKSKAETKKRVRNFVPDDSGIDWKELYNRDEMETCKIDQLKKYLRSVGLPLLGKKGDLIERINDSLKQTCANDSIKKEQPSAMDV